MKKPHTIDLNEMHFISHDINNNEVIVGYSSDKKNIVFTKTTGEPFTSENDISKSLFYKAIAILAIETELITETDKLIPLKGTLSEDKYYIISEQLPTPKKAIDSNKKKKNQKHL